MEAVVTALTLLAAVVVSSSLARWSRLPLPLVQIGLGALIAIPMIHTFGPHSLQMFEIVTDEVPAAL